MAVVTVTSVAYDDSTDVLTVVCDFSALGTSPAVVPVSLHPDALGERIARESLADSSAALEQVVLEQASRLAPDATGVAVEWQAPADDQKTTELSALAGEIEAARAFFESF